MDFRATKNGWFDAFLISFSCVFVVFSNCDFVFYFVWQAEVNFLGDLVHPNLVKLIGYCIEDDQRLLVYEFMPRGSLENHLFRSTYIPFFRCSVDDMDMVKFCTFLSAGYCRVSATSMVNQDENSSRCCQRACFSSRGGRKTSDIP